MSAVWLNSRSSSALITRRLCFFFSVCVLRLYHKVESLQSVSRLWLMSQPADSKNIWPFFSILEIDWLFNWFVRTDCPLIVGKLHHILQKDFSEESTEDMN